jgi:molybdenum cofactor cytidylyltransferase
MDKDKIAAIILAAGLSSRMGSFKPLLPLMGTSLIERMINLFRSAGINDIHVVVGHRADETAPLIEGLGAQSIMNHRYHDGMFSSVSAGVQSLTSKTSGFFILPVDVPLIRRQTLLDLFNCFALRTGKICYPTFLGKRGHPPLISVAFAQGIKCWSGHNGLRGFLALHEKGVAEVPVADQYILKDLDTRADYQWMAKRIKRYAIPSAAECRALMTKRLTVPEGVFDHCRAVAGVALQIGKAFQAAGCRLDLGLIVSAALVHDMARGEPNHASEGARRLREMEFPLLADIVEVHMDISIADGVPISEAEVVFLADKLIQGYHRVDLWERFQLKLKKYGSNPVVRDRILSRKKNAFKVKNRVEAFIGKQIVEMLHGFSKKTYEHSEF